MQKIPAPVAVALVAVALVVLGFVVFRSVNKPAGDTGNIEAISKEMMSQKPKDAPSFPPGFDPSQGASMPGGKGKGGR